MNNSGKAPLPTPERIEEIKLENEELVNTLKRVPIPSLICMSGRISELLAALEESQQQNARWKEAVNGLMMADTDVQRDLVEAQQTIARHETALNEIIAYSTDENAVDVASVSMGHVEGEKTDGM